MTTKLELFAKKVSELKALMKSEGKTALTEAFSEFFAANPMAKKIVWTQYTPYFNDGDSCVFRVGELCLKLDHTKVSEDVAKCLGADPADEDDYSDEDAYESDANLLEALEKPSSWYNPATKAGVENRGLTSEERQLVTNFDALVTQTSGLDELFESVFGDHVKVVATADNIEVQDYDHD